METVFIELIKQLNGSVFTLIAVLFVVFWLIYKAGEITGSFRGFTKKNDKIDSSIDMIKDSINKVQATTDLLYQAHLSTVKAHSPLALSSKGQEVATYINLDQKVDKHWKDIEKEFCRVNVKSNPYDIQITALNIAEDCFDKIFDEVERDQIKTYAYKIGMNLLEIYPIIGIKIRDRILADKA